MINSQDDENHSWLLFCYSNCTLARKVEQVNNIKLSLFYLYKILAEATASCIFLARMGARKEDLEVMELFD